MNQDGGYKESKMGDRKMSTTLEPVKPQYGRYKPENCKLDLNRRSSVSAWSVTPAREVNPIHTSSFHNQVFLWAVLRVGNNSVCFGSESRVSSVDVPINAYNKISVQCYEIPKLFLTIDRESVSTIDLSSIDIPWNSAVQQFDRYLYPRHRNSKRITNSAEIQITFTASIARPLYM
jgi:hypothetical protein